MQSVTGNRCGHDTANPRFCDQSRRGKGGQPPVISTVCSLLKKAYSNRNLLKTWRNQNPSGRQRRSEKREAMVSTMQYLVANWFQLDTRRCATPSHNYLSFQQAPKVNTIKNKVSSRWKGKISQGRIQDVISEFIRAGYMTSTHSRRKLANGNWESSPAVRTFTKKFFLELGGQTLWESVREAGERKYKKHEKEAIKLQLSLQEYLFPSWTVSPQVARKLKKCRPSWEREPTKPTAKDKREIRESREYKNYFQQKVEQLFMEHPPDTPHKWSIPEITDNAKRLANKRFGLAA